MKKILIAVAVVASAVVSGSAIASAWSENMFGGEMTLEGTLTPATSVLPWEAQIGGAVSGLDAKIEAGKDYAEIPVTRAIPILGIRTKESKAFIGQNNFSPRIDFHSAVDISGFDKGTTNLTLPVTDEHGENIGNIVASFTAAAVASWKSVESGDGGAANLYGDKSAFAGGLAAKEEGVSLNSYELAKSIIPDVADNFDPQGYKVEGVNWFYGTSEGSTYSAFYAGGIEGGSYIKIKLKKSATMDDRAIVWKASLPITVSYQ